MVRLKSVCPLDEIAAVATGVPPARRRVTEPTVRPERVTWPRQVIPAEVASAWLSTLAPPDEWDAAPLLTVQPPSTVQAPASSRSPSVTRSLRVASPSVNAP